VWASEIEPSAILVTKKHFPEMKHLGDITKIDGARIDPVDIITFGSPCTRLSVAGRHDGFDISFRCNGPKDAAHETYERKVRATIKWQYLYTDTCPVCSATIKETNESALFFHAIRIIGEMRNETNGQYPRFILWENVPGAFSSNSGHDFKTVLEEIAECEIPMPQSGRWAPAGMVRGGGRSLAWRVLDAKHFGLAQRRKRIFLIADLGGSTAPEILFEPQGGSWDTAQGGEEGEGTPPDSEGGSREPGGRIDGGDSAVTFQDITGTLRAKAGAPKHASDWERLVCQPPAKTYSLQGSMIGRNDKNGPQGSGINEDVSFTLNTTDRHAVVYRQDEGYRQNPACPEDAASQVTTSGEGLKDHAFASSSFARYTEGVGTLRSSGGDCGGGSETLVVSENVLPPSEERKPRYIVRKLTPVETERLMGFPDNWTEGHSDLKRYQMTGNSVAVPCVVYVLGMLRRNFP